MFFVDSDFFEGDGADATFSARLKSGGNGKILVQVYATSGMVAKSPYRVDYGYTTSGNGWFIPQSMATNPMAGLIGVASDVCASGCVGWVQIRGPIEAVSFAVASQTGSIGDAVSWASAAGLKATSSTYIGAVHQVGILTAQATGTNTGDIFLVGNCNAESRA